MISKVERITVKEFEQLVKIERTHGSDNCEYEVTEKAMNMYKKYYSCYENWDVVHIKSINIKKYKDDGTCLLINGLKKMTADILTEIKSPIKKIVSKEEKVPDEGEKIVKDVLNGKLLSKHKLACYVKSFAYVYYWIGNMLPIPGGANPFGLSDRGTWRNKIMYLCGEREAETNLNVWKDWRSELPKQWKEEFYLQDCFEGDKVKLFYKGDSKETNNYNQVYFSKRFNQKEWLINNTKLIIQRSYRIVNMVEGDFNEHQTEEIKEIYKYVFENNGVTDTDINNNIDLF